jgi:hypothetical protein
MHTTVYSHTFSINLRNLYLAEGQHTNAAYKIPIPQAPVNFSELPIL